MAAKLVDLLTNDEIRQLRTSPTYSVESDYYIHNLTVEELHELWFLIGPSEYPDPQIVPPVVCSADAIRILNQRALEKKLPIFE